MSLNPRSGLVSLPLVPERVASFSVLDASPSDTSAAEWAASKISWRQIPQWSAALEEVKAGVF